MINGPVKLGSAVLPAVCRHLQGGLSCGSRQESVNSAMLKSSRSITSSPFPTVGTCALHARWHSTLHAPPRPDSDTPPFSSPSFASARAASVWPIYSRWQRHTRTHTRAAALVGWRRGGRRRGDVENGATSTVDATLPINNVSSQCSPSASLRHGCGFSHSASMPTFSRPVSRCSSCKATSLSSPLQRISG